MLLVDTYNARGFGQWNEVRRSVTKGAKAFYILGPIRKKVENLRKKKGVQREEVEATNEGGFVEILVGFKAIPVFRYEDASGKVLPTFRPRDPPPLLEVAEKFGMKVQYERLPAPDMYGATDHTNRTIILATEDWDTFFHELGHAIHRTFEPKRKSGHGQGPEAETIAQLVAATLARVHGRPADSFSWSYISSYARSNDPQKVGRLCMRVLDRTKKVLDLIYAANYSHQDN